MKSAIIFPCVMRIGSKHGAETACRGQADETLAVGEAGEPPGPAVAVEADVVVGGVEALWMPAGEVGSIAFERARSAPRRGGRV